MTMKYRLALSLCAMAAALFAISPADAAHTGKRVHIKYEKKSLARAGSVKTLVRVSRIKTLARAGSVHKIIRASREELELNSDGSPNLKSAAVLVVDFNDGQTIYGKNPQTVTPIASITKLMTAMVSLDAALPLDEMIEITQADTDMLKHTSSRLTVGTELSRRNMLQLALMSSENRAAFSLSRSYPGGREAFIGAMNRKAVELGMTNTRFFDPTGLTSQNVSTAEDLVRMVRAAYQYPLIRQFTTTSAYEVETAAGRNLQFHNSNALVKSGSWNIGLSKTGFINEAGRCLVMQANIGLRPVVIVLLDSWGKYTRTADANRIKKWLESHLGHRPVA